MGIYLGNQNLTFGKQGENGKSAYEIVQEQGYSGTEEEFGISLVNVIEAQILLGKFNSQVSWNEDETVYTETWIYDNNNYKQITTEVSDTQFTKQLYINDILAGTWTMTIDEDNRMVTTSYSASE